MKITNVTSVYTSAHCQGLEFGYYYDFDAGTPDTPGYCDVEITHVKAEGSEINILPFLDETLLLKIGDEIAEYCRWEYAAA